MERSKIEEIMERYSGTTINNEVGKPWSGTKELMLVDKIKKLRILHHSTLKQKMEVNL